MSEKGRALSVIRKDYLNSSKGFEIYVALIEVLLDIDTATPESTGAAITW